MAEIPNLMPRPRLKWESNQKHDFVDVPGLGRFSVKLVSSGTSLCHITLNGVRILQRGAMEECKEAVQHYVDNRNPDLDDLNQPGVVQAKASKED